MAMDRTAIRTRHESGARPGAPPLITLAGVEKVYRTGQGRVPRAARRRSRDRRRRDGRGRRPVGQRQDDDPEHDHRHRPARPPAAVTVDGGSSTSMTEEQLAVWRGANVGIVFQFFQLLPTLTALENAALPLDFARRGSQARALRARGAQPRARRAGATRATTCRPSSRAASSSASRSRARWPPTRS